MAVEVRDDHGLVLQLAFPASKGNVMNNHVPIRSVDAVSTGGRPNLLDKRLEDRIPSCCARGNRIGWGETEIDEWPRGKVSGKKVPTR